MANQSGRFIHVQAHRGNCSKVMENTLASFLSAVEVGADSIELDVNVSRDGTLVVFHDSEFSPENTRDATNRPLVKKIAINQLKLADIKTLIVDDETRLKVPNRLGPEARRVPTLEEVFNALDQSKHPNSKKIIIDVEIKSESERPHLSPDPAAWAKMVLDLVRAKGPEKRVHMRSFDHRVLYEIRKLAPLFPIGALFDAGFTSAGWSEITDRLRPDLVAPPRDEVSKDLVEIMHQNKIKVIPYTANSIDEWRKLRGLGVDGITTDDPEGLINFLGNCKTSP
jgi:glycerophosphoryl diester phosphodiesterase